MSRQHKRWHKNGRIFHDPLTPNQEVWTTSVTDDENVDNGDGSFSPFVFDEITGELKYGRSAVDFESDHQRIRGGGKTLITSSKIFVEHRIGGTWTTCPHGAPLRTIERFPERAVIKLDFLDARIRWQDIPGRTEQQGDIPLTFQTRTRVQSGNTATFSIRFRSRRAGNYRFIIVNEGIKKRVAENFEWIESTLGPEKNVSGEWETYNTGMRFGDLEWRWSIEEAPFRNAQIIERPDNSLNLRLTIGPHQLESNEQLIISPDTWGATEIASDNDDCQEQDDTTVDLNGWDSDGNRVGKSNSGAASFDMGVRFDNMPAALATASSIDAGTKIEPYHEWDSNDGVDILVKGILEDDPDDWNTGTRPSERTKTTASVSHTVPGTTSNNTRYTAIPDIAAVIEEIRDDQTWATGNAIALVIEEDANANGARFQWDDKGAGSGLDVTELTVVYTVAGGGAVTSSGALDSELATISGTATRASTSTGALTSPVATVSGTATVTNIVTATGALSSESASLTGTATRASTSTGSLASELSTITGTATRASVSHTPNDLVSENGTMAGTATAAAGPVVTASGALVSEEAVIAGTASRESVSHTPNDLVSDNATISGVATRGVNSSGALSSEVATMAGTASTAGVINATGALSSELASISGTATRASTSSGALASELATVTGTATRIAISFGTLVSPVASTAGNATAAGSSTLVTATGDMQAEPATIDATIRFTRNASGSMQANVAALFGVSFNTATLAEDTPTTINTSDYNFDLGNVPQMEDAEAYEALLELHEAIEIIADNLP